MPYSHKQLTITLILDNISLLDRKGLSIEDIPSSKEELDQLSDIELMNLLRSLQALNRTPTS